MQRKRHLLGIGIAIALALVGWRVVKSAGGRPSTHANDAPPAPPQTVAVATVITQRLDRQTHLPGELQAYQDVAIYPKLQGFVAAIDVDRGSIVREGQLLARLIAPELAAQRSEANAKAEAARAQQLEAQAKLAADLATYQRLKAASAEPGVVAGNDLEGAQKTAQADRAHVRAAQETEQAALDAVRSFQDIESYLQITAPFDGVITERNVHTGSLVGPAAGSGSLPMLRLRQITPLRLVVAVPENEIAGVAEGAEVAFSVPAFPGETFTGTIQRVAHAVDVKTRTMPVELDVPNASARLAPGMYADVVWPIRRPQDSLFVTTAAIVTTTERTFVVRLRDGVAEWVDVKRGMPMGDLVEVFGDLQPGDQVVARGTDELRPGTHVVAQPAPTAS